MPAQDSNCSGSFPAIETQGTVLKKEDFTMNKSIIMLGFLCALLSTVILHARVTKEKSVKTYATVAAQFAYHVPEAQDCCTAHYYF